MKKIILSKDLSFPLELVTQSVGILAKRRAGKSYAARRLSEGIFKAGQQICIIDPKGDWWGMRYAKDGQSPGLPIFIFGGERGDIPLEVRSGSLVAKLLVEERVSILLDLSQFRKREVASFMTDFLEDLYRLKAQDRFRTPLMLLVDEADAIAPQKPQMEETRMLGAIEDIVRRGGQRGIGCTMISQRSAVLNKNVLTQIQVLMCLRTIAPQDLAAIDEWIKVHGDVEQRKVLMGSLPSLPVGTCWVWSPGWPTDDGYFQRVEVESITTFDSGATPKPGEKKIAPRNIAHVDLDALRLQMSEVVTKAKENDPAELKRRIKELEQEIKKKQAVAPAAKLAPGFEKMIAEVPALREEAAVLRSRLKQFEKLHKDLMRAAHTVSRSIADAAQAMVAFDKIMTEHEEVVKNQVKTPATTVPIHRPAVVDPGRAIDHSIMGNGKPGGAMMRMLQAAAMFGTISRHRMSLLSRMSPTSGSFNTYLSEMKKRGWIEGNGKEFKITAEGKQSAGEVGSLPTDPRELVNLWCENLGSGGGCARMLRALADRYPDGFLREDLASNVSMSATSGSFNTYLSTLNKQGLIEKRDGAIFVSKEIFA